MPARSRARRRALEVLYEAEARGEDQLVRLEKRRALQSDPAITPYAVELVEGVTAHLAQIDGAISANSMGWTLPRMPAVDRAVLRIGTYELLFRDDVPDAVAVDEAVDLVAAMSTDESPRFVNGLLGRLMSIKSELLAEFAVAPVATPVAPEDSCDQDEPEPDPVPEDEADTPLPPPAQADAIVVQMPDAPRGDVNEPEQTSLFDA